MNSEVQQMWWRVGIACTILIGFVGLIWLLVRGWKRKVKKWNLEAQQAKEQRLRERVKILSNFFGCRLGVIIREASGRIPGYESELIENLIGFGATIVKIPPKQARKMYDELMCEGGTQNTNLDVDFYIIGTFYNEPAKSHLRWIDYRLYDGKPTEILAAGREDVDYVGATNMPLINISCEKMGLKIKELREKAALAPTATASAQN